MTVLISDEATEAAVLRLAAAWGVSPVEAIRRAAESALSGDRAGDESKNRLEAIRRAQIRARGYPDSGLGADKAFFDALSEP